MPYTPSEDSFLLEKELVSYLKSLEEKERKKLRILDMGSGSGFQAMACVKSEIPRKNILCVDIDKEAIVYLKKYKLRVKHSNLFSKLNKREKFDLIIFNPPYLPEDKTNYDNKPDTTGGRKGYETSIEFLKQAKNYLNKKGVILLLLSSFTKPNIVKNEAKKIGYKIKEVARQNLFFEKLLIWKLNL